MLNKLKKFPTRVVLSLTVIAVSTTAAMANSQLSRIDVLLRHKLAAHNVTAVTPPPAQNPALVELGRNLFFEKEIAGRRNIPCSTCHSPILGSADAQSQSRGQGAIGLGPHRRKDDEEPFLLLPRNTLSLWNRGVEDWTVMFTQNLLITLSMRLFLSCY